MANEKIRTELDLENVGYLEHVQQVKQADNELTQSFQGVEQAATLASHSVDTATLSHVHFGRGVMQASYAIQDFTSVLGNQGFIGALNSIQNNIPLILTSLGAGAGLAGIISILSVGIGLLVSNFGKLTEGWKDGQTEAETKRMKDLAEAIDHAREAGKKFLDQQAEEAKTPQKALERAETMFGGEAVRKILESGSLDTTLISMGWNPATGAAAPGSKPGEPRLYEDLVKMMRGEQGVAAWAKPYLDEVRKVVETAVGQMRAGDQRAVGQVHSMIGEGDQDIRRVLRGEETAAEQRVRLAKEAEAHRAQRPTQTPEELQAEIERQNRLNTVEQKKLDDAKAAARARQSIDLARRASAAAEQRDRQTFAQESRLGRQDVAEERQIGQLHQANQRILDMQAHGQMAQWDAAAAIAQNNAQINQLMNDQRRLRQQMARLRGQANQITQQNGGGN